MSGEGERENDAKIIDAMGKQTRNKTKSPC